MKLFVNSLPKSGTHLLHKCLELYGYQANGHISAGMFLGSNAKAICRRLFMRAFRQGYIIGIDTPVEVPRSWVNSRLGCVKDNQFITAHVGYTKDIYYAVNDYSLKPIVVIRDPRAVLNSFVHYVQTLKRHVLYGEFSNLSVVEKYEAALYGRRFKAAVLQPINLRCRSLDPWIYNSEALLVKFEDLVGAGGGGSKDRQIQALEQLCSYARLDTSKAEYVADSLFGPGKSTFRKGTVDSWRDEMPVNIQRASSDELRGLLGAWGYSD